MKPGNPRDEKEMQLQRNESSVITKEDGDGLTSNEKETQLLQRANRKQHQPGDGLLPFDAETVSGMTVPVLMD